MKGVLTFPLCEVITDKFELGREDNLNIQAYVDKRILTVVIKPNCSLLNRTRISEYPLKIFKQHLSC